VGGPDTAGPRPGFAAAVALTQLLLLPPLDDLLLVELRLLDPRRAVERPDPRLLVERLLVERDELDRRLVEREELERPLLEPDAAAASCF
jgi:hypothetical protein